MVGSRGRYSEKWAVLITPLGSTAHPCLYEPVDNRTIYATPSFEDLKKEDCCSLSARHGAMTRYLVGTPLQEQKSAGKEPII
jgi:hypothetical protein